MKMMFALLSNQADDFLNYTQEKSAHDGKVIFDLKDIFCRFTANGIAATTLGFEADCIRNEDSYIYKLTKKILDEFTGPIGSLKLLFAFFSPNIYKLTGLRIISKEVLEFFQKAIVDVMHEREEKGISRPDVIQLLLQAKKGQLKNDAKDVDDKNHTNFSANIEYDVGSPSKKSIVWDDDDMLAQGWIFYGAGFETTSSLLQMTVYELAKNPNIQQKLIEEIDQVIAISGNKSVTYESLHEMKFLDMVISESLRMWPPVHQTDRSCTKDFNLNLGDGKVLKIKKGDLIMLPIYSLHHDSTYYENPEKFDPYRFSDENKGNINAGAYIPFGSGPRVCIGSRFALMEAKLVIFTILSKFRFKMCDKTPKQITFIASLTMAVRENIFVEFEIRK